jgi:hypothetical protein
LELGILTENVQEFTVSCEDQEWNAPGSIFFVKNRDVLISAWDGVFFEMERSPSEVD